tara:strand:- start:222 stop:1160 length:939 start_codon:yes stop_codon:yes gene_type:complete
MANTWNESGTTWSQGDWGNQNNYTLAISGVTFASDVGSVIGASEQGWGRDTYGNEPWGESNSPVVAISGFSFSASLGTLAYAQSESGWGRDEYGIGNWGENTTTVAIDGLSMSMDLGPNGWGVNSYGNGQWGGEFTFKPESIIGISGFDTTAVIGSVTTNFDMNFDVSGVTMGAGLGTLNINNGADHLQGLASLTTAAAVGSILPADVVGISGVTFATALGTVEATDAQIVDITGVTFTAAVGAVTVDDMAVGLSGQTFAATTGSIAIDQITIGLTGQTFTASLNTVGFGQLGYSDVDITGNTSYTDVTHAA